MAALSIIRDQSLRTDEPLWDDGEIGGNKKRGKKGKEGGWKKESKTNGGEKVDVPAVTDDDKDSSSQQVDDTHTTAQASPPLQKSRRILSASSDFLIGRYI